MKMERDGQFIRGEKELFERMVPYLSALYLVLFSEQTGIWVGNICTTSA